MKLIVCIDDKYGIAFNNRRQSRDAVLNADIVAHAAGANIYMSAYSKKLFADIPNAKAIECPAESCGKGEFCFIELESPAPYIDSVEELIIYRWNSSYPMDVTLGFEPRSAGFTLSQSTEFIGKSHECITKEIWKK